MWRKCRQIAINRPTSQPAERAISHKSRRGVILRRTRAIARPDAAAAVDAATTIHRAALKNYRV